MPFAPRIPTLAYPERNADPRYMPPVDNVYMARQPPRAHQPRIFDARGYYTAHEERPSPGFGHTWDFDGRSRAYDLESQ
jgi:hypothetical protein